MQHPFGDKVDKAREAVGNGMRSAPLPGRNPVHVGDDEDFRRGRHDSRQNRPDPMSRSNGDGRRYSPFDDRDEPQAPIPRREDRPPQNDQRPRQDQKVSAKSAGSLSVAVIALLFGGALWFLGWGYTLHGLMIGTNYLLRFANSDIQLGPPETWMYFAFLWVGVSFSRVEWSSPTVENLKGKATGDIIAAWSIWFIVNAIDYGTTAAGMSQPGGPEIPFLSDFVRFSLGPISAGILISAGFVTWIPERIIRYGWNNLPDAWRKRLSDLWAWAWSNIQRWGK